MSKTIIAIKNPEETPLVIDDGFVLDGNEVAEQYGKQIKRGAFVTLIDVDYDGDADGDAELYIADRVEDRVYLQSNDQVGDGGNSIDAVGSVHTYADDVPLESDEPDPADLETFTVFGNNDDNENFVAVVSATEETVREVGINAGVVDEGCEGMVDIVLIVKGDQSSAEVVS